MTKKHYDFLADILRLANRGARKAQEENRRLGLPNVYVIEGKVVFVLPDGTITHEYNFDKNKDTLLTNKSE